MLNELKIVLKPLLIFVIVVIGGAYILSISEGVQFFESLYRTFLLVATVTEYPVKTSNGKIISSFLVVIGLGLILYIATSIARVLMKIDVQKILRKRSK